MNTQEVILVSEKDQELGTMEKMQVHQQGILHPAFSIFIFNKNGKMLLQQRAVEKYHGAQLWSNTCCSHPYPGEETEVAAQRRLYEEMGFTTDLKKIFEFVYKTEVENDLIEHEYDHVFTGVYEGPINTNKNEVADYCYEEMDRIRGAINEQPEKFTAWFKIAFPTIDAWWQQKFEK